MVHDMFKVQGSRFNGSGRWEERERGSFGSRTLDFGPSMGRRALALLGGILCLIGVASVSAQEVSPKILSLDVEGNLRSDKALIVSTSGLSVGEMLTTENEQSAIRRLYSLGIFRDIRLLIRGPSAEGVHLVIAVDEFPTVAKIVFEGNKKIKMKELHKALRFSEGQVVSAKAIHDAVFRIKDLYQEQGYLLAQVQPELMPLKETDKRMLTFHIREGKKVQVKHIEILGNTAFSDGKIKKQMKTREDRWWRGADFKEETFEEDKDKIIAFYRAHGYRYARVMRDSLYYDDSKRHLFIDIVVEEGPQYRFGTFTWDGNRAFSDKRLADLVTVSDGDIYNEEEFAKIYSNFLAAYQEQGYLSISIQPQEEVEGHRINIHFTIQEGTPSKVHRIVIVGNTKTKEKVIRRELTLFPGEVFQRSALERSLRNVYLLNFFKDIQHDMEPLPNGDVDVTITVEEKSTGQASMGAGYSEQYKLVGSIGLSVPNLFGNGQRLDFNWDFGRRRETFHLSFTEPWLFDTPTSGSFDIYRTTDKYIRDFDERRQGGTFRIGKRLSWPDDYSRLYVRYRLEEVEYLNFDPDYTDPYGLKDQKWPQKTSSLRATYFRDSRDLPQFPTTGSVTSYALELAGGLLQGDENYHKHVVDSEFYFPLAWKFVLMLKSRIGYINGFNKDHYVPFSERFMPGGISFDGMIRGYADRSVGPIEKGKEIGGRTMFITTAEIQFPIAEQQVYGLLFADGGNAWRRLSETDPFDLKRSLGVGVRVMAPMIGMIGFDFAYGFDHIGSDGKREGKWRTHFQFGQAF